MKAQEYGALISAAPDLLKQTEKLHWILHELYHGNSFSPQQLWNWLVDAKKVLNKSNGAA